MPFLRPHTIRAEHTAKHTNVSAPETVTVKNTKFKTKIHGATEAAACSSRAFL
jgi:hypothetical protein